MGLDMYVYATCEDLAMTVDIKVAMTDIMIHQWRKHPNLHGWMEQLYRRKGGTAEFNCVGVKLTEDDLRELETTITSHKLPDTCGFFFGQTDGSEYNDDLAFIHKARNAIDNGLSIYYSSWW